MRNLCAAGAAAVALAVCFLLPQVRAGASAPAGDAAGVERACLDYIDSIYLMKPELLDGSTSADLQKIGFMFDPETGAYEMSPMSFETLRGLAGSYNAEGVIPPDAPREVRVLRVMDQTAEAKLTAAWGIDYLHLAKVEGRWQIQHIVWQTPPREASASDAAAVKRACLDYAESAYLMKPENIDRSVHPEVVKVGYISRDGGASYERLPMNFQQLRALVATWNEGGRFGPDARKDVEVLDVSDQTACAVLTAEWGVDLFHLAKFDGEWKIVQVMWQTDPPGAKAGG